MADTTFNADTAAFDMAVIDRIHQFNRFGMKLGLERMDELLKNWEAPGRTAGDTRSRGLMGRARSQVFRRGT